MAESYTRTNGGGAPAPDVSLAMELLARLLPGADVELLVSALLAERGRPLRDASSPTEPNSELSPAERELHRVRTLFRLGDAARAMQHAMNNPLTALLAEAQLLQLEPLAEEYQLALARMVELARRVVTVTRRLDAQPASRVR